VRSARGVAPNYLDDMTSRAGGAVMAVRLCREAPP